MAKKYLGEFEVMLLIAMIRLNSDAYGTTIRQEIEKKAGRKASLGAIYTTLERMERKGLISSRLGEATPERGGRAKKFFKIEAEGYRRLDESLNALNRMLEGLSIKPQVRGARP